MFGGDDKATFSIYIYVYIYNEKLRLKKIEAKIASLTRTLIRAPKSTRGPGTFSDIKLADSKFEVLDLETNVFTYYNSIRQIARTFACGHSAVQYSLNNPGARAYKGRYVFKKIST